jgi:hypothetical protein
MLDPEQTVICFANRAYLPYTSQLIGVISSVSFWGTVYVWWIQAYVGIKLLAFTFFQMSCRF